MNHSDSAAETESEHDLPPGTFWTIPNTLCVIRIVGAPGLIVIALLGDGRWFLLWYLFLALTDWLDGKIAVRWRLRTVIGARLDSLADVLMYGALLIGAIVLRGSVLLDEWPWIAAPVSTYLISSLYGLRKFGKVPNYHTRGAKVSWLLMIVALVSLMMEWSLWPLRIAMIGVTITNLEAIAITTILPQWHADVISVFKAKQLAKRSQPPPSSC